MEPKGYTKFVLTKKGKKSKTFKLKKMTTRQNALDIADEKMRTGKMTAAQANVLLVQMAGVKIVQSKLPMDLRKAFNDAVKNGELGHVKKEGMRPEAYHHKNARPRALEMRDEIFRNSISNLSKAFVRHEDL